MDIGYDTFQLQPTPLKGRSPLPSELSSPRGASLFYLKEPPLPIFQPSPKRPSDAATSTYLSSPADSLRPQSAGLNFPVSPFGIASPINGYGGRSVNTPIESSFAPILDGHSRISPTNLSAAAAAARGESTTTVRNRHFSSLFSRIESIKANPNTFVDGVPASQAPMPSSYELQDSCHAASPDPGLSSHDAGLGLGGGSPLQLRPPNRSGFGTGRSPGSRRPGLRRALNFGSSPDQETPLQDREGAVSLPSPDPILPIASLKGADGGVANGSIEDEELYLSVKICYDSTPRSGRLADQSTPTKHLHDEGEDVGKTSQTALTNDNDDTSPRNIMNCNDIASLARSPVSMRPGITRREDIIDSPAVKEATNAAVKAALQANAKTRMMCGAILSPVLSDDVKSMATKQRRPQRAAAAGAAAATAAAAASAATGLPPASRRSSSMRLSTASSVHSTPFTAAFQMDANGYDAVSKAMREGNASFLPHVMSAEVIAPAGASRCSCKKSRCLKLYCDCFKACGYCGDGCSCVGCCNREDNMATVVSARKAILARNPHAFTEKISESTTSEGATVPQHRQGCNCKRSKCLKKYCECFNAAVPCGDQCKCENCSNTVELATAGRVPYRNPPARISTSGIGASSLSTGIGHPMSSVKTTATNSNNIHRYPMAMSTGKSTHFPNGVVSPMPLSNGLVPLPGELVSRVEPSHRRDLEEKLAESNGLPHLTPVSGLLDVGPSPSPHNTTLKMESQPGLGGQCTEEEQEQPPSVGYRWHEKRDELLSNQSSGGLETSEAVTYDGDTYTVVAGLATESETNMMANREMYPTQSPPSVRRRSARRLASKTSLRGNDPNDEHDLENQLHIHINKSRAIPETHFAGTDVKDTMPSQAENRGIRLTPKKRKPMRTSTSAAM